MILNFHDQLDQVSIVTKTNRTTTCLIMHMQSTPKTKLSCCDLSNWVQSKMKTKQDNNMIDYIGLVYVKT